MERGPISRLRTQRRLWGLSQSELAYLLGCRCRTQVSRIEQEARAPNLHIALQCELLFGLLPGEMFPRMFERAEEQLIHRAYALYRKLGRSKSAAAVRKRRLLEKCLQRSISKGKQYGQSNV